MIQPPQKTLLAGNQAFNTQPFQRTLAISAAPTLSHVPGLNSHSLSLQQTQVEFEGSYGMCVLGGALCIQENEAGR